MSKLALCIGINNYPGTDMDLSGCVNDANDWAAELRSRGFAVQQLLDEQATKAGMIAGFTQVIGDAAAGDLVVITFSGHGTYQFDTSSPDEGDNEVDGLDEALCPFDIQTNDAALIDDEIHALFAARKPGVRIVLISDSCHSGTVNREIVRSAATATSPRPRFMPMGNWMSAARLLNTQPRAPVAAAKARPGESAFRESTDDIGDVLLSGCEEGEGHFSYDAFIKGRANGAFTFHALKALKTLPASATYADWHRAVSAELPTPQYDQTPQIVGSDAAQAQMVFA